eukprot:Skav236799  [mRNA]  locus=scaffold1361:572805:575320:- [translate_table: standard]
MLAVWLLFRQTVDEGRLRETQRLLQLHRYHLAAALFLLSGAVEEAALVLANHLKDLQLVILVTRRHQDVCQGIMKKHIEELPVNGDPWLRLLLAYHSGDPGDSIDLMKDVEDVTSVEQELFDSSLRPCQDHRGELAKVAEQLLPK